MRGSFRPVNGVVADAKLGGEVARFQRAGGSSLSISAACRRPASQAGNLLSRHQDIAVDVPNHHLCGTRSRWALITCFLETS